MRPQFSLILILLSLAYLPVNGIGLGFLQIVDIDGEASAPGHEGEIEIHGIDWGFLRPIPDMESPRTRGDTIFEDLVLTKEIDKSTPKLIEACASGKVFAQAEITLLKEAGGGQVEYLKVTLTNVQISSYNFHGSGGSGPPISSAGLSYEKLKIVYTEFDESGSSKGDVEATWDIEAGTP